MSDHIYKSLELTGSSSLGVEQAVENAVARAAKTIHNLRWVEVKDIRAEIENDTVSHWQVTMKLGFTLD